MLKRKLIMAFVLSYAIQSCSYNASSSQAANLGGVIIPEPTQVDFKSEVFLLRLNDFLLREDLSAEQRAQLHYERGVKYDSVGLRHVARIDINQALRLNPNYADAYNFLGIQFTQMQEFNYAYEAFDSAIELSPRHEFAYFNRGIALYYGARPKLALEDFNYFYQRQPNDAFRMLWLYLAEVEVDPIKAKQALIKHSALVNAQEWVKNIVNLYLGNISQQTLLDNLSVNIDVQPIQISTAEIENSHPANMADVNEIANKRLNERLCETYFYLGKYNLLKNNIADAKMFFKLALSTNVYEYVEHRYAQLELDLIDKVSPARY